MRKNLTNKHSYCLFASLVFIFIFLVSIYPVEAIAFAKFSAASTATVISPPVTLANGLAGVGSSTVSSGGTYASTTVTAGLAFNVNANPVISSSTPSIDGSPASGSVNGGTSVAITLTTTTANDLIFLAVSIAGTGKVNSITNIGTATWQSRANLTDGSNVRVETWYLVSQSKLTSQKVTVTISANFAFYVVAFGIKNANTANPFDSNSVLPSTSTGSGKTQSVAVSTSNPNDLVIGALAGSVASGQAPNPAKVGSYTLLIGAHQQRDAIGVEYLSATSQLSGSTVSFTTPSSIRWAMAGDAIQGISVPTPTTNTDLSAPSTTGSISVPDGQSAYIWTPAYTTATTIYAGSWVMDLWASAASADTMSIKIVQINSSNTVTSTIASGNTPTISTIKSEKITTFTGCPQITIQPGDRLAVILTNAAGGSASFTVYWGTAQVTNFKTPSAYDYILNVVNSAASQYFLSFSTLSSSSLSRLTNLTFYVYSPTTNCIVVTNGALTQSSSPTITLPAGSTMYIALSASANSFGSSTLSIQLQFSPNSNMHPFTNEQIDLTVN